jgi:GT2 family glycosyltransferase
MMESLGSRPRHDDHRIARSIRGWLESPGGHSTTATGVLVSGWAFAAGAPIVRLHATGLGPPRPVHYGLRRDDVAEVYGDEPNALLSGFRAYLEIDRETAGRHLEVWATFEDGRSVRLFKRRLTRGQSGIGARISAAARESVRHPRLLFSRRSWANAIAFVSRDALPPADARAAASADVHAPSATEPRASLASFLSSGSRLAIPATGAPVVSIVVVVWNRADLTLQCLRVLAAQMDVATEVIVVDNASTDETPALLAKIDGVRVIRNASNLGFTMSVNLGAKVARGEFLLLLNNDAEVLPGCLHHLVQTARASNATGAVGGKLVFPDGRLQEAGSIIWSDGSCDAYGRGGDPQAPEFNFERAVDFCSAALLLTPRVVFDSLGGFDERYKPAYYEDADYCTRLWKHGYRVVYQPKAAAIHHEFGSAASSGAGIELQRERRPIFVSRHAEWLASQPARDSGVLVARSHPHQQPAVTVIDDAVPDPRMGAGFPRAAELLHALEAIGYRVTLYATSGDPRAPSSAGFPRVEAIANGPSGLRAFLASRRPRLLIVSRPHNMEYVKAAIGSDFSALGIQCVYDAEAIYAVREIGRRKAIGQALSEAEQHALIDGELALARGCASVLTVSEADRQVFAGAGVANVRVLGHALEARPTANAFERRDAILFVGAFGPGSPNDDAVAFFCREVLPALRGVGCSAPLVVAGAHIPESITTIGDASVSWRRDLDDLTPLYDRARVFVAPTRYAAGIALKVLEAAARGVPIVATPLVARQLGWQAGVELLIAGEPPEFARAITSLFADRTLWSGLRDAALARVTLDCDRAAFRSAVQEALRAAQAGSDRTP